MINETVLKDLGWLGTRYKVRLVQSNKGVALDIREYLVTETFEGFTRKGIRLYNCEEILALGESLKVAAKQLPAGKPAKKEGV